MSTPNSRRTGRASLPFTPISTPPPSQNRKDSVAEPKNDFLRHALDATRAKHVTPTQTPVDPKVAQPDMLKKSPSDPWLDNAKDEDAATHMTPVRRPRRPSDGLRMRTQRELQAENEALKNAQMDLKMRLQLLSEQNIKLKDQAEEDQKRIKELEPYEDRVHNLREANDRLAHKIQDLEEEVDELRAQNQEILMISEETVENMKKREEALEEAAELIVGLEEDKAALTEEVGQLKMQAASKVEHAKDKFPIRVHSIDESRPSTSHFDSDYYSMPDSPKDKPSQESLPSTFVSERAKKFITMKKESQQSTQELHKRLSNASLKMKEKKEEPAPQVPKIPEAYLQQPAASGLRRVPSVRATSLSPALAYDPYASIQAGSAPQTPTGGLRARFQNGLSLDTSPRHPRPASKRSSNGSSPLASKSKKPSPGSEAPVPPERHSSRAALTSYAIEQLSANPEPDQQSEAGTESTWEIPPSVVSDVPSTDIVTNYRGPWYNQISSWGSAPSTRPSVGNRSVQRSTSYTETNFLFNPAEDEDDFLRKTQSFGRRPR